MDEMTEFIEQLRGSKYIRERRFGDISSFNFTKEAFYGGHWNELTMKARGLFINTRTGKIVARGYDKFFNVGENPENTMSALEKKAVYPIEVYQKENGYLGLISWDLDKDDFFFATKSMIEGPYADNLKRIFFDSGIRTEKVADFLKRANMFDSTVTLVVEVIDPVNDPHIIEYDREKVVLLDIVSNTLEPHFTIYPLVSVKAFEFGMDVKRHVKTIMSWDEVTELERLCQHPRYADINKKSFEGYVFRDSHNLMFKLKTAYYLKWKGYRRAATRILSGTNAGVEDAFLRWVEENRAALSCDCDIIKLRNMYEGEKI